MNGDPTTEARPVGVDDLHAFVDGQLDDERLAAVLEHLQAHPADAVRVAQWQAQRQQLRRLHREQDLSPAPPAMARTLRRARVREVLVPAGTAAAAVLVLAIAAAVAWWPSATTVPAAMAKAPAFVRDAKVAHAVYTPEVRHPVEVGAADEQHLVQWLSKRLGQPLHAPSLQAQGFALLGGRLLPGDPVPRAQFMYEDTQRRRLTLYVAVFPPGAAPAATEFRTVRDGALTSFYWVEDRFGYALAGDLPPDQLQALARETHAQLSR